MWCLLSTVALEFPSPLFNVVRWLKDEICYIAELSEKFVLIDPKIFLIMIILKSILSLPFIFAFTIIMRFGPEAEFLGEWCQKHISYHILLFVSH